ncbi:MAG: CPBP family intramembrane metalloprotease [Gammaproteobacteria bacterium]|nr:MAG: CPBP family intramembrane metalloprotease [Gammaproteobacteria bacterium]
MARKPRFPGGSPWVYRDHGGSHGGSTVCARVTEFCIARERPYFGPGKRWVLFAEVRRWHRSGGATARLQAAASALTPMTEASFGTYRSVAGTGGPSRAAALAEILAMLALVLSYIWVWHKRFPGDDLVVTFLYFALCYGSHLRRHESARSVGLRLDNWRPAARQACLPVAVGAAVPLAIGAALGTWHFGPVGSLLSLPWHVAWGTAQQYGLLCLLYRRSLDTFGSVRGAALAAAGAFALFHLPNPLLVTVTFLGGLVCCTLYRRVPNVLVLGLAHAMISTVVFSALPISITHHMRVGPGYFTVATGLAHAN